MMDIVIGSVVSGKGAITTGREMSDITITNVAYSSLRLCDTRHGLRDLRLPLAATGNALEPYRHLQLQINDFLL
jgi:hypothetical protein